MHRAFSPENSEEDGPGLTTFLAFRPGTLSENPSRKGHDWLFTCLPQNTRARGGHAKISLGFTHKGFRSCRSPTVLGGGSAAAAQSPQSQELLHVLGAG